MTGRYWCVYGVKTAGTYQLQSLVKCQSLVDIVAQALQVTQGSVSLVTVVDILLDAQLLQQQHTTDTQQNLLLQAVLPVATIQAVGDRLVKLRVHIVVGIQQIQLYTTHVYTPNISVNLVVSVRHINNHRVTILIQLTLDRQRAKVLCLVVGHLLSLHREALCKVTKAVQETNGTHINIRVRSLLHVVTSQHTQST